MNAKAAGLAALFVVAARGAAAQVVFEQKGSLAAGDSTLADGRRVDWHKVPFAAGTRYLASATSPEADIALLLRFADGATLDNNDFEGAEPALAYTAVRSETVEVGVANALDPQDASYEVLVERVTPGRAVQGGQKLTRTIEADSGGRRGWKTDSLLLSGGRGDRATVRVRSSDFAPMLRVQSRGGFWDEAAGNASNSEAALSFAFLQQGQVEIVVRAKDPTSGGRYEIEIERQPPARVLRVGTDAQGRMKAGTELFLLEGKRGQAVAVAVESGDFDPSVRLVDRFGRRAANDDSGEGATAGLSHVFADDEPVAVAVLRSSDGDAGAYRVSVRKLDFDPKDYAIDDLSELEDDGSVSGYLGVTDLQRNSRYVHRFTFTGQADEVVRLELSSASFDAYLEVIGPDGFYASDDDGLGGLDALLETACPVEGTYTVRVSTAADWQTGLYDLRFARKGVAEPILDVQALLEHRDQRDISGRYFDTYRINLKEGVSLTVEMRSEDIDSFLYVWDANGDDIHSDDDSGGGNNARVRIQNAAAGTWTVYATSSGRGATGAYTLRARSY